MAQQNLSAPESAQINMTEPLYGAAADRVRDQLREPTDLEVAVSVAQQLLDSDQVLSLREALRLLLRAIGAEPSEPDTVHHANGLEFRVIPADSYDARMARDVRELTMEDGTVWTVGAPIGWHGASAAWKTPAPAGNAQAARHEYGESMRRRDRRQLDLRPSTWREGQR